MGALTVAGVVFAVIMAAGLAGLMLGPRMPGRHIDAASRDAVRLVAGFLATLAALVLGLLIASAKSNYDEHRSQLQRIAADVVSLDRALIRYGEGAEAARAVMRSALIAEFGRLSAANRLRGTGLDLPVRDVRLLGFHDRL